MCNIPNMNSITPIQPTSYLYTQIYTPLNEQLSKQAQLEQRTKRVIVERALAEYFDNHETEDREDEIVGT